MNARYHGVLAVVCALSWFLVGLHAPVVHRITEHGQTPGRSLIVVLTCLAGSALTSLWILLRAGALSARSSDPESPTG